MDHFPLAALLAADLTRHELPRRAQPEAALFETRRAHRPCARRPRVLVAARLRHLAVRLDPTIECSPAR